MARRDDVLTWCAQLGGYEAWALICAKADFVADEQGITPLMEGTAHGRKLV